MEKKFFSLGTRIFLALFIVAALSMMCVSGVIFYRLSNVRDTLERSHEQVHEQTLGKSSEITKKQSINQLLASTKAGAELADDVFSDFKRSVEIIAADAERIYDNEDEYTGVIVERPDVANAGKLAVQLLYSARVDEEDEALNEETLLLGNIRDTLLNVHESFEPIVADCIATESGIMIMADLISDTKFDDNGGYLPYEADERPWYIGVKSTGQTYFTKLSRDAHTSRTGIMCGAPVYHKGRLVAVVEAGMYLDNLEAAISDAVKDQTEGANICIINEDGELVCSTAKSGVFAVDFENMTDLRLLDDELSGFITDAVSGSTDARKLEIDGTEYYVVSSPLPTVGWTYVVSIPSRAVDADTKELSGELERIAQNASLETDTILSGAIYSYIIVAVIILLFVTILATVLSRKLVASITRLTDKVRKIDGDELDFSWDGKGNDEIGVLAMAFATMTDRMKEYIEEVKTITADKERIGAELSLATRIQADMLPNIFPAFPERDEFDIYASMDPAKEVGGDFYDFFLIDDTHLGIVIADVSGKGVPAALFMMVSKILVQNFAMSGLSPSVVLKSVNDQICANNREEMFVTVWFGILDTDTGRVVAANAGHEYPAIMRSGGLYELFKDKHGFVIGGMEGIGYKEYELWLTPGSKLFVYTDGVPEATNADNEMFGIQRMIDALNADTSLTPKKTLKKIRSSVDEFVMDTEPFDDLTMVCLEYKGK